jgi:hypothetical protein
MIDLSNILADHVLWLEDEGGRCADLSGTDLNGADLSSVDLSRADLSCVELTSANLRGADLSGADLSAVDLMNCTGDGKTVCSMQVTPYTIVVYEDFIQIGCQRHRAADWASFGDREIVAMGGQRALRWWRAHKSLVFAFQIANKS